MRCHEAKNPPRSFVSIDYELAPLEREASQRRDDMLLTGVVAGALVMALTALLFRLLVMRPVYAIAGAARRIAAGNLAARAEVVGSNELALLARDFNYMAQRIEEQVAHIEAARTESELLYTLVVEAAKNLETSEVAAGVSRVLLEKLRPRHVGFFLETTDGGSWPAAPPGSKKWQAERACWNRFSSAAQSHCERCSPAYQRKLSRTPAARRSYNWCGTRTV
jgi:HAMP domain-containing protein